MKGKIVKFDKYCPTCKYSEASPTSEPCDECLATPGREEGEETDEPLHYIKGDKNDHD